MAIYQLATSNLFVIADVPAFTRPDGLLVEVVDQTLALQQTVQVISTSQRPSQTLNLTQTVSVNKTVQLSANNTLPLSSGGVRTKDYQVGNLLVFSQIAVKVLPQEVTSFLALSQSVDVNRGLFSSLSLQQVVSCNIIKLVSIVHTLDFDQGVTAIIDDDPQFVALARPALIGDYDPADLAIPPTPASPVPVTFTGVGGTLTFNIVQYGDVDRVEHTRISRRTIGEQLIVYRDATWPKTETLKFSLSDLSVTQGKAMLDFIEQNLAASIQLRDWIGVHWSGVIINPETVLVQNGRDAQCGGRYNLDIEFQGVQTL